MFHRAGLFFSAAYQRKERQRVLYLSYIVFVHKKTLKKQARELFDGLFCCYGYIFIPLQAFFPIKIF